MRLLGHPLHPMLVHFPIALWTLASFCDGLVLLGVREAWPIAWLCTAGGLAAAVPAMVAGLIDFRAVPERSVSLAVRHMAIMACASLAFLGALFLRSDGVSPSDAPNLSAMATGAAGLLLLLVGAWHGAQLVYGQGVGVKTPPD